MQMPVFQLEGVEVPTSVDGDPSAVHRINLTVRRGEIVCVTHTPRARMAVVGDILCGDRFPGTGKASFLGHAWDRLSARAYAELQGALRRVFETPTWLRYLEVSEELLLNERYHSKRPEREVLKEAAAWCRQFGLPGVPTGRPSGLSVQDQRRVALARAFVGAPRGFILEDPLGRGMRSLARPLADALCGATRRGAGAVALLPSEGCDLPGARFVEYRELLSTVDRSREAAAFSRVEVK